MDLHSVGYGVPPTLSEELLEAGPSCPAVLSVGLKIKVAWHKAKRSTTRSADGPQLHVNSSSSYGKILMAHLDPTLVQQVVHVPKRQEKLDVQDTARKMISGKVMK